MGRPGFFEIITAPSASKAVIVVPCSTAMRLSSFTSSLGNTIPICLKTAADGVFVYAVRAASLSVFIHKCSFLQRGGEPLDEGSRLLSAESGNSAARNQAPATAARFSVPDRGARLAPPF